MRKQEKNVIKNRFNGKRTKSRKKCLANIFIQRKKSVPVIPETKKSKSKNKVLVGVVKEGNTQPDEGC